MQAFQIVRLGAPLEQRRIAKPQPKGRQVLARTLVTGVCHTDVHVANGDLGEVQLPLTPGHEGVGVVEAVGRDVVGLNVGDRIGVPWLGSACLNCALCAAGRENLCESQQATGFAVDGSFAEYFLADERFAVKLPESIADAQAAPILCAGLTAFAALKELRAPVGARIVISGACGGLGHLGVQYAKALGYEVVAVDEFNGSEAKAQMAASLGADFVIDAKKPRSDWFDDDSTTKKTATTTTLGTAEKPIEGAVVFAPVPQAVSDAVEYVSPGATIVCLALPPGYFQIHTKTFVLKGLRLQASIVGTLRDLVEALRYVEEGRVSVTVEERPFEAVNEVLDALRKCQIRGRVVLRLASRSATRHQ